jgi:uncharacterized protein YdeI (YjbR/CyaY-like superfamily)
MTKTQQTETKNGIPAFYAKTNKEWRRWLAKNGESEKSVWLIIYHKDSKTSSINYNAAIEEALCFGWIDSKASGRDQESSYLFFTPRKPKSNWSNINRERVKKMTEKGLMMPSGQIFIDSAKKTGTWEALADAQNAVIPDDLQQLFDTHETALRNFSAFAPSAKRMILEWISGAKKPETRQRRIEQTVKLAADNIKAK